MSASRFRCGLQQAQGVVVQQRESRATFHRRTFQVPVRGDARLDEDHAFLAEAARGHGVALHIAQTFEQDSLPLAFGLGGDLANGWGD